MTTDSRTPSLPSPTARPTPAQEPNRRPAAVCATVPDEATACPACGETMRLWANYYRCRTCGYKESCCF